MAYQDQIRVLERFNEKVEKLQRLRFLEDAAQGGAIVEWTKGIGWDGIHVGPKEESFDSVVLTLRFFVQNSEATSLFNMGNLYQELRVGIATVDEFLQLRQQINNYLDSPSNLAIYDERQMTHREIMEMFLYGDLAHANKNHEATFKAVSQTPFYPIFQEDFVGTLCCVIRGLREIQNVNKKAIAELSVLTNSDCP
jgi:hypothetical protein